MKRPSLSLIGIVVVLGALHAGTGPAEAAQVFMSGSQLRVEAEPGETNHISLAPFEYGSHGELASRPKNWMVMEWGSADLQAGSGCATKKSGQMPIVRCPVPASVVVELGSGNDRFDGGLFGASGSFAVYGGAGDDTFGGLSPGWVVYGGDGDDEVHKSERWQARRLDFHGGLGFDLINASNIRCPIAWTPDNTANDGPPRERDNYRADVEDVLSWNNNGHGAAHGMVPADACHADPEPAEASAASASGAAETEAAPPATDSQVVGDPAPGAQTPAAPSSAPVADAPAVETPTDAVAFDRAAAEAALGPAEDTDPPVIEIVIAVLVTIPALVLTGWMVRSLLFD